MRNVENKNCWGVGGGGGGSYVVLHTPECREDIDLLIFM